MTPAELAAEALAHANASTERTTLDGTDADGRSMDHWDGCSPRFYDDVTIGEWRRKDVHDAALAHLAARVVAERERAERAHERAAREETATLAALARVDELLAALRAVKDKVAETDGYTSVWMLAHKAIEADAEEAGEGVGCD